MATIAVGDIHGNLPALTDVLNQLRPEVGVRDVVVFLGDYIDRGRDSKACVEAILSFRTEVSAQVVCLRGNHEDWLLRTLMDYSRHSWLVGMEAFDTIRSYSPEAVNVLREACGEAGVQLFIGQCVLPYELFFNSMPPAHRTFFLELQRCFQSPDCICTHAGLNPSVKRLEDQSSECLIWGHDDFPNGYNGDATVVYGHWDNADTDSAGWPKPRIVGRTIGIDTISHGVLTAVRMPDQRVFQSRRYKTTALGV
ncbi:MAG TPA: metallophosphoesterase family protein [Terriglobia bacterium]|nr:metallophosphoesterase family protein [Terriglobia bacterium]